MESLQPRVDLHARRAANGFWKFAAVFAAGRVWKVFDVDGAKPEATQGIVVILQSAGRRYALLVDQLIGRHGGGQKSEAIIARYREFPPATIWATAASR